MLQHRARLAKRVGLAANSAIALQEYQVANAADINADQQAFWNGIGGETWVARQNHTDRVLKSVSEALLVHGAPQAGEHILDVGCGCGASTLDFARAVGPKGSVEALDISGPMLAEAERRASAAGLNNISWRRADAASATLANYDLLTSNFGLMFFGDPVAAFKHLANAANNGARMSFVCWRSLAENPWMQVPMNAVLAHLPPRPKGNPNAPGMFAFADPARTTEVLTAAGWMPPEFEKLDRDLDIAAGRGLDEAIVQTTKIGAVNSWLRDQPEAIVTAAIASLREVLTPYSNGAHVTLPGAMWLVSSRPA